MSRNSDSNDILNTLNFLFPGDDVFEVSCYKPKTQKHILWRLEFHKGNMLAGWFNDKLIAARVIEQLNEQVHPAALYVTLNSCNPDLLARACNRIGANVQRTDDSNIVKRLNLLIDGDPVRASGISASDEEKQWAKDRITEVGKFLKECGWPNPLFGDSGNGNHLVYKIDLPNTPETTALIEKVLKALDQRFTDERVSIDTTVFNPARITKIFGTMARKGDDIPGRPHRMARILYLPRKLEIVSFEQLASLASEYSEPETSNTINSHRPLSQSPIQQSGAGTLQTLDVPEYLQRYGRKVVKTKFKGNSTLYCLEECVFNPDHKGNEAAIGQTSEGKLFYQCFHASCKGKTWHDARAIISGNDPLFEKPHSSPQGTATPFDDGEDEQEVKPAFLKLPDPPPLDVLPDQLRHVVEKAAEAFAVPLEVPFTSLLIAASTCIGRTRGISIKEGWTEHANLYMALVGKSGTGKSPCTKAFMSPIFRMEKEWHEEYQEQMKQYKKEMAAYEKAVKQKKANIPDEPEKPVWKQLYVDDATVESLTSALSGNPRGILWYRDELSGLILDLDKYAGKDGGTKARLMSAYDCGPWKTNRISASRQIYIPNACLSLFGTIQPEILSSVFTHSDKVSGFLPRIVFIRTVQKKAPVWTDVSLQMEDRAVLERMISAMLRFDFEDEAPVKIRVTPDAKGFYVKWFDQLSLQPWTDFDAESYDAILAKLKGQCLRVCLILHSMEAIFSNRSEKEFVKPETMQRAIRLTDWIKNHQKAVWEFFGRDNLITESSPLDRRIIKAVLDLEGKIEKGRLLVSLIAEKVNEGVSEQFKVSPVSIGKTCKKKLKLDNGRTGKGRFIIITPEKLESFRLFSKQSVTSVTSVINTCNIEKYSSDKPFQTDTPVTPDHPTIDDGSDSLNGKGKSVIPMNPCLSKDYDRCDRCDSSETSEWETGVI